MLRDAWLEHIPDIRPAGCGPAETLASNEVIRRASGDVAVNGEHRFQPEVHPASHLFHETVFAVHRALRVSCAATQQAADGLPTWSISTAHHGSLIALQALLGFCGITYLEIEGRYFLMDVFPSAKKGERKRGSNLVASSDEVQLIRIQRMGHRHWWLVLQRLLRTAANDFDCWQPFDPLLLSCDAQLLSKQRNELHYRGTWFFDDLFSEQQIDMFGQLDVEGVQEIVHKLHDEGGSDGTLILNHILLENSIAMLRDVADRSRRLYAEVERIDHTIGQFKNV